MNPNAIPPPETPLVRSAGHAARLRFLRLWVVASFAAGCAMSALDAALLQRRESYFTGGFLSANHLTGPGEIALFLLLSLLTDLAVAGVIAGIVMWLAASLRPRACLAAGVLAALVPLVAVDVVSYELMRYLGDAADVGLMFDLTGGSVAELLAAAAGHLALPTALVGSGVAVGVGLTWLVNRGDSGTPLGRPAALVLGVPVLLLVVSLTAAAATVGNDRLLDGFLRKPSGKALAVGLEALTDTDGDGFGLTSRFPDPDPRDARVFPHALDLPGNGIDEDGIGGDLPPAPRAPVPAPDAAPWSRRTDVVLIVLESFRFDMLGAEFDGRPVTPVLDALAARGISSSRAYSHNGYTAQSRYHLLSGRLADGDGASSLIDDFRANGYMAAYVSGQDESFGGPRYDVGFARADVAIDARTDRDRRYSTFTTAGSLAVPYSVVEARVTEVLQTAVPQDRAMFLYVNFHDTHFPYSHAGIETLTSGARLRRAGIVPAARDALWATYVNTAANVDRAIGRVLDRVREVRGREPAVIVTSDHGESLFDEGFLGHGHALNDVQTRIPLIAANLPLVVDEPFGQVDLRRAIGDALRTPDAEPSVPRLRADAGGEVFQYLGTVNRPRQIAFRTAAGLVAYDFRTRRARVHGSEWQHPEDLSAPERGEFVRLVQFWERLMLERRGLADD